MHHLVEPPSGQQIGFPEFNGGKKNRESSATQIHIKSHLKAVNKTNKTK